MRHNFEELEQYFMHKCNSDNRSRCRSVVANTACSEYQDSVDEFISRHSVKNGIISNENIRKLQRDLQLNYINVNKNDTQSNCKITDNVDTEIFVSKIIKYNRRLDKVIVKLMKAIKNEREESELQQIINILQEKHKRNVMSLAKDSYRKLLKSEENFIPESQNPKLLLKPSTDLSCKVDNRYVKSENMIGYIKEIKRHNTYHNNSFCFPRSSCTNTINLHRDDGRTNLYSSMNSMTIRNVNRDNLTLYPTIRVPYEKKYLPKYSLPKAYSKTPETDRSVNRSISQQRTLNGPVERLDKVKKKSLTNTSLKVETKIDDLVKTINLLIEEIQAQKSYKVDKKIETINEDKENSNEVLISLKKNTLNVEKTQDASVNTDVSIVCARSAKVESRFDLVKFRNKFRSTVIGSKSSTKMNTQIVKPTMSIGLMATVATSDKSVEVSRPFTILVKSTQETIMNEENSISSNEDNKTTSVKGTNTDPLGVVALLRVSAETIRQLISNVPTIDYYSYLPFFHSSNYLEKGELQFVCDICGAAFNKASLLNDHIKSHELGFARNCGVCQHVLNSEYVRGSELYKCRYCGQRFTRAYCCELHQQSCAKRFGLHDSASSLFPLP
ncbi:PREDICTED: uncharacterized protein LOC106114345 [Papilio xuthus]|uniref:Uncharacterized protein LOC106114345 n=1 Tax=Papilio xuthus TaxID=66420 RepID=A0AAJ6Z100_PAPXU|nr:PREDICTED: uncharacterized protein LOC106114345 [Papilio xuthus]